MHRGSTWALLGIAPTADLGAIQRAYARRLDDPSLEDDSSLAIALHEAFESARFAAQWLKPEDVPDLPAEPAPAANPPVARALPLAIEPPAAPAPAQQSEPHLERVPKAVERQPPQPTILQPQRKKSPWRPRRPAPPIATGTPSIAVDAPSPVRRLPKGLRLLPMLIAGAAAYAILDAFGAFAPAQPPVPEPERSVSHQRAAPESGLPTGELGKSVAHIDRALEEKFGDALDIGRIEARNPALLAKLEALWARNSQADDAFEQFSREVGALADRWYADALTSSDVALTTERSRLTIDMAIALRARDRAQCARFLEGDRRWNPALGLDEALHAREIDLMALTLLETDGKARPAAPAAIPASVVQTAALRAGTTPEAIRAWLTRKARVPENCDIAIAVTETVLALPDAERLPILRVL